MLKRSPNQDRNNLTRFSNVVWSAPNNITSNITIEQHESALNSSPDCLSALLQFNITERQERFLRLILNGKVMMV